MAERIKSEATRRREKLVAQGLLEAPTKNPRKVVSGRLGALATHGSAWLANLPTRQELSAAVTRQAVTAIARGSAAECAAFLRDLALGRGRYADAPLRERRQAACDVLQLAGVDFQVQLERESKPLSEMNREEIEAEIRDLEAKRERALAQSSAQDSTLAKMKEIAQIVDAEIIAQENSAGDASTDAELEDQLR